MPHICTRMSSKWIEGLKAKYEGMKALEEITRDEGCNLLGPVWCSADIVRIVL